MSSDIVALIHNLRTSKLFAECPHCGDEFSLSDSIMFDGTKQFPTEAEAVRQLRQQELEDKIKELQKRQISADQGAEKKAIEVGIGKIIEKVLPAYKSFNIPLSDCRFLSEPIDMIIFDGASNMKINKITFMDIKTGNASLNKHQRQVRDAIKDHNVRCKLI